MAVVALTHWLSSEGGTDEGGFGHVPHAGRSYWLSAASGVIGPRAARAPYVRHRAPRGAAQGGGSGSDALGPPTGSRKSLTGAARRKAIEGGGSGGGGTECGGGGAGTGPGGGGGGVGYGRVTWDLRDSPPVLRSPLPHFHPPSPGSADVAAAAPGVAPSGPPGTPPRGGGGGRGEPLHRARV